MTEAEHLAISAIRQTMAAYTIAGDRFRLDELAACFTPDGVLETPLWQAVGRDEIVARLRGGGSLGAVKPRFVRHHLTTCLIEPGPDGTATGRSYFMVLTDIGPDHAGTYLDRFWQVDGRWLFASRSVQVDWKSEASRFERQVLGRWGQDRTDPQGA